MDRYAAYQQLLQDSQRQPRDLETARQQALAEQALSEGTQTDFWRVLTDEINQHIRAEELRFLDRMARSYEEYLQAWSRRQALIAVLAIPERAQEKAS